MEVIKTQETMEKLSSSKKAKVIPTTQQKTNATLSTSDATLSTSDATPSTSDATLSTSDATLSTSDATLSTSDAILSTSDATLSTSDATLSTSDATPATTALLQVHWGILGCSKIASDFCIAMQFCHSHKVVAVASKSCERASNFAKKFGIEKHYDSYEVLLENAQVDVVYVATNTSEHYSLSMLVLQAGKALLCEKPLCMSLQQCRSLEETSRRHRRLAVEGLWSLFLPSNDRLRRALVHGEVGEVKNVRVEMGFNFGEDVQIRSKHLGGGVTMGLGCYALHLVAMVFEDSPLKVEAKGELDGEGLDTRVEIRMEFEGGRRAEIKLNGVEETPRDAVIEGSDGEIIMKNFWCCEEITVCGKVHKYPFPSPTTPTTYPSTVGFMHEIERVGEAWRRGLVAVGEVGFETSGRVYGMIDRVLKQLNVKYESSLLSVIQE